MTSINVNNSLWTDLLENAQMINIAGCKRAYNALHATGEWYTGSREYIQDFARICIETRSGDFCSSVLYMWAHRVDPYTLLAIAAECSNLGMCLIACRMLDAAGLDVRMGVTDARHRAMICNQQMVVVIMDVWLRMHA